MDKPRTAVIVKKKGSFSVHTSFTKACKAYGWERTNFKEVAKEHDGYKISKIPMEVTIDCLELMEFVSRPSTSISYENNYHKDESFQVDFSGYGKGYSVEVIVEREYEKPWSNGEEHGCSYSGGGYHYFTPKST